VGAALGLLDEGLEEEVEVAAGAAGVEEGLAGALAAAGELGGFAEVAADEGGVEAAARGGREAERGGRGGVRGGLRGGGLRGGVHGGGLLYAGSGRRALVRGRAAVFAGDVFLGHKKMKKSFGCAAASASRSGFGNFAGGGI